MIWRSTLGLAVVAGAALALAACGGSGKSAAPSTGGVAGASTQQMSGHVVRVTEREYAIALSTMSPAPGPTTFVVHNTGKVAHSLEIDGPGVSDMRIAGTIQPGTTKTLHVTLRSGTYEVYCPVPGHKALGMDTHVTVGSAPTGAAPTSTTKKKKSSSGGSAWG